MHLDARSGLDPAKGGPTNLPELRNVLFDACSGPSPAKQALETFLGRGGCTLPNTLPLETLSGQRKVWTFSRQRKVHFDACSAILNLALAEIARNNNNEVSDLI